MNTCMHICGSSGLLCTMQVNLIVDHHLMYEMVILFQTLVQLYCTHATMGIYSLALNLSAAAMYLVPPVLLNDVALPRGQHHQPVQVYFILEAINVLNL